MNIFDEARAIDGMLRMIGATQQELASRLGVSQSYVANKLRLLRHSEPVLAALRTAALTERHARALLKLTSDEDKLCAIEVIARQGMSVARAEAYIDALLVDRKDRPIKANVSAFLNNLTASLARIQSSGIPAVSERRETDSQIVLTITIPKER